MCAETDEKSPCFPKKGKTSKYLTKSMKNSENQMSLLGPQEQMNPRTWETKQEKAEKEQKALLNTCLGTLGKTTLNLDPLEKDLKNEVKQGSFNKENPFEYKESAGSSRASESDEEETHVKQVIEDTAPDGATINLKGEGSFKYLPFEKEDALIRTDSIDVGEQDTKQLDSAKSKTDLSFEKHEDEQNEKSVADCHSQSYSVPNYGISELVSLETENRLSSYKLKAVIPCDQPNIYQSAVSNNADITSHLRGGVSENIMGQSMKIYCQKSPFKVSDHSLDNRFHNLFDHICMLHYLLHGEKDKEQLLHFVETELEENYSTEELSEKNEKEEKEGNTDMCRENGGKPEKFGDDFELYGKRDQKQAWNLISNLEDILEKEIEKKGKEEGCCSLSEHGERRWKKELDEKHKFWPPRRAHHRWNSGKNIWRKNKKQNKQKFLHDGNHSRWRPKDPHVGPDSSRKKRSHEKMNRRSGKKFKRKQRWFRRKKQDFERWLLDNSFMNLTSCTAQMRCRSGGQRNNGFKAGNQDSGDASGDESDSEEDNDGTEQNNKGHGDKDGDAGSNSKEHGNGKKQGAKENKLKVTGSPFTERRTPSGLGCATDRSKKADFGQEPSLPRPVLDDEHKAQRIVREEEWKAFVNRGGGKSPVHVIQQAKSKQMKQTASAAVVEGIRVLQHAAISQNEICDVIGTATNFRLNVGSQEWKKFNMCLRNVMHDISLASQTHDFDCMLCLVLGGLLMHLADTTHNGETNSCEQCAQVVCLIIKHAEVCMHADRKKERDSQADLCYKICRFANWNKAKVVENLDSLRVKVKKYCTKALGNPDSNEFAACEQGNSHASSETQFVLAEGVDNDSPPSTGRSSNSSLSLKGNVITTPSSTASETPSAQTETPSVKDMQVINSGLGSGSISRAAAVMPNSPVPHTSAGSTIAGNAQSSLVRRPSSRRTPAIPQPIKEETETGPGSKDDIERLIYRRYGNSSKGSDPYDTQPTYGERNRVESMRVEVFHDQEQFMSLWNRPTGVKGIGEVVFAHNSQLHVVARFWERKRDHCEQTGSCPYQHREEGVILAEMKEHFTILKTRYQKHQQWERLTHLGSGMSGKCHLAIDLKTGFKFCCKKIHLLRYEQQEVSLWAEMHNPFIVRLYGAIRHGVRIYIFSEFVDGGSLAACINEQKLLGRRLSHWTALNYFQQILKALAYLQRKNMLHEDIKADNILLRRNSTQLAVTDFGTSRHLRDPVELKNKSPVGSPTHWSPEKASMEGHGFPSDVWAALCVLVHMLSGAHPWVKRYMNASILNFIIYSKPAPLEDVPANVQAEVKDLMAKGFIKDPQSRPSASELLRHPAFDILEKGTPESYFSTLLSSAAELASARKVPTQGEERPPVEFENNPTSKTETETVENIVLYSKTIPSSPYQESRGRLSSVQQTDLSGVEFSHEKNDEGEEENGKQNTNQNSDKIDNETPDLDRERNDNKEDTAQKLKPESSIEEVVVQNGSSEDLTQSNRHVDQSIQGKGNEYDNDCTPPDTKRKLSKSQSEVNDLLNPDITNLLPFLDELLPSHGDSENNHSIRSFFEDTYNGSEDFQKGKMQQLELQKFEPRPKSVGLVPLLSVFRESLHNSIPSQRSSITVSDELASQTLVKELDVGFIPSKEHEPSREELEGQATRYPSTFQVSSSSDEYNSKDLFGSGPEIEDENARVVGYTLSSDARRNSPKHSENAPLSSSSLGSGSSLVASIDHNSAGSSGLSNLQQRKPADLKIEMVHPHNKITSSSTAGTSAVIDESKKSQTWVQPPSSQGSHSGVIHTPSTGRLTSSSRKSSGNTGSGYSPFFNPSRGSSVIEEQEKQLEEMKAEVMSQCGSDNGKFADMLEFQQDNNSIDEFDKEDEDGDLKSTLSTLRGEIDENSLVGHKIEFYDDKSKRLFEMRVREYPIYWKNLIGDVRRKIKTYGYTHFALQDFNGRQVEFDDTLKLNKIKIISLKEPSQYSCWCSQCQGY